MTISVDFDIERDFINIDGDNKPAIPVSLKSSDDVPIEFPAILDTGSSYSIFNADYLKAMDLNLLDGNRISVTSLGGDFFFYSHEIVITLFDEYSFKLNIGFKENVPRNILGRDFLNNIHFCIRENYQKSFLKFCS
jgi:hypothetical protein